MKAMTYTEIAHLIGTFGLPYAYNQFTDDVPEAPPFICFFYSYDDMHADNENYQSVVTLNIELYTENKSFLTESQIEQKLKEAGFSWAKESNYIGSERMWQTAYEMGVLITEE